VSPKIEDQRVLRTKILDFLNHYEMLSIAFQRRILDKLFYAKFLRWTVVRDWNAMRPFIEALRNEPGQPPRPSLFCEFEALALEWQTEIELEAMVPGQDRRSLLERVISVWERLTGP